MSKKFVELPLLGEGGKVIFLDIDKIDVIKDRDVFTGVEESVVYFCDLQFFIAMSAYDVHREIKTIIDKSKT